MLDLALRGCSIVDGTGSPAFGGDVGIAEGRIVSIGSDVSAARHTVDVDGLCVAPGFIDVHTHYDAQLMWDPAATPSALHGVTTVIGGNCGFTIAPVSNSTHEYVTQMLACVEGMPTDSLNATLSWNWESFGQWLDQLEGNLAINSGFSVGHSTIRRLVMGEDWQRAAHEDEIVKMEREVDLALDAGALGFSSSWSEAHRDHLRQPVPSRFSELEELIRLASRLRGRPGTSLEFIPSAERVFPDRAIDSMVQMSVAAGRPLNWNFLAIRPEVSREGIAAQLSASDRAAEKGARVIALSLPTALVVHLNLLTAVQYNIVPAWADLLALPMEERLHAFSDPATRDMLRESMRGRREYFLNFGPMVVEGVGAPELAGLVGRSFDDIARERNRPVLDAFLDVVVSDRFATCFVAPPESNDDASWRQRLELWRDPRVVVGASDAGAHVDALTTFSFFTDFVGPIVRDRGLLPLEEAVHLVTDVPAKLYGIKDRGRIKEGAYADLVAFDPATVASGDVSLKNDLPAGGKRLSVPGIGIERLFVNGVETFTKGVWNGTTPGTLFRGGRDTE